MCSFALLSLKDLEVTSHRDANFLTVLISFFRRSSFIFVHDSILISALTILKSIVNYSLYYIYQDKNRKLNDL